MAKIPAFWRILPIFLLLASVTAGCYRQVGDEAQPTLISQGLPTLTYTPSPTSTETPTPFVEVTEEPEVAEDTEEVAEEDLALDVIIADIATPTPDVTAIAQEQQPPPADPFVLTATVLVLEITQTAEFSITQTAEALGIGATPTPIPTETPEEFVQPDAFATAPPAPIGGVCIHEVRAGENLFRLSLRYGVPINDLARASGITNIQLIVVGQRITIPGCGTTGILPPPTSVPVGAASPGGLGAQTTGTTGAAAGGIRTTHVVQQYETLFEISLRYGVPMQSIANANGIVNPNVIIIGQELLIPSQ